MHLGLKTQIGAGVLVFSAATWLIAADLSASKLDGLTVHEWGTFTSIAGDDGYPVDWDSLRGTDDLPGFVQNAGARNRKFTFNGTVRMETPVLYFYSPRELTADVRVQFPHGAITEWYPKADTATYESKSELDRYQTVYSSSNIYAIQQLLSKPPSDLDRKMVKVGTTDWVDTSMRTVAGTISWNGIKVQPNATPAFPRENQPSRYYAARETEAAALTVESQHEKFLFDRGVGRIPVPLTARVVSNGKIAVNNVTEETVPAIILFENRGGKIGYRNAGTLKDEIRFDSLALDGSVTALRRELESVLIQQGLYPKEAHAMVETWQDSWFEEGTRVIYVVPTATITAALPLQVDPAPSQTARIFVGRVELLTPDMKQTIEDAVAKKDYTSVQRYGRFLQPWLDRIYRADTRTINAVLAKVP